MCVDAGEAATDLTAGGGGKFGEKWLKRVRVMFTEKTGDGEVDD